MDTEDGNKINQEKNQLLGMWGMLNYEQSFGKDQHFTSETDEGHAWIFQRDRVEAD